jgi:MoaA/NifB/PqqE/SkfB family radical SAM enzyme
MEGLRRKFRSRLTTAGWFLSFLKNRVPGQLVIQITDRCNARCPQCGMRVTERYDRSKLGKEEVMRIIDTAARRGFSALSFTGGEPLLYFDEVMDLSRHALERGIEYVRTGTNGFLFMHSERPDFRDRVSRMAEKIAESGLYTFWISIDSSVAEIHESMRGLPGVIRGIEKALPIFHEHGVYPAANLGINRNIGGKFPETISNRLQYYLYFREGFSRFYRFVSDLGFTIVNACYPMSLDGDSSGLSAVYGATSRSDVVKFSREEKVEIYRALFDAIPEFRQRIRIFTPRSSLYSLIHQHTVDSGHGYPCRGGLDYFFIEARTGDTFPCGYRGGENLGKFWDLEDADLFDGPECRKCDWECFRDPSTLLGPLLRFRANPVRLMRRFSDDPLYHRLWMDDLRYFRACDFFSGKHPPDFSKMNVYASGSRKIVCGRA